MVRRLQAVFHSGVGLDHRLFITAHTPAAFTISVVFRLAD